MRKPYQADSPPAKKAPVLWIASPRNGKRIVGIMLNERHVGVMTHYHKSRTVPCLGARMNCVPCSEGWAARWKGYYPLWIGPGNIVLGEVTANAQQRVAAWIGPAGARSLRGCTVTITRPGSSPQAAVCLQIEPPPENRKIEMLPAEVDVLGALERIWGLDYTDQNRDVIGHAHYDGAEPVADQADAG